MWVLGICVSLLVLGWVWVKGPKVEVTEATEYEQRLDRQLVRLVASIRDRGGNKT